MSLVCSTNNTTKHLLVLVKSKTSMDITIHEDADGWSRSGLPYEQPSCLEPEKQKVYYDPTLWESRKYKREKE